MISSLQIALTIINNGTSCSKVQLLASVAEGHRSGNGTAFVAKASLEKVLPLHSAARPEAVAWQFWKAAVRAAKGLQSHTAHAVGTRGAWPNPPARRKAGASNEKAGV